jgi:DNA-binding NarL/FixJ family response regulator
MLGLHQHFAANCSDVALNGRLGSIIKPDNCPVPLPFTRREHEITRLLSHRLSNKEIAEALSLSVRTVEVHVYHGLLRQFDEVEAPR